MDILRWLRIDDIVGPVHLEYTFVNTAKIGNYCGKNAGDCKMAFWNGRVLVPLSAVRWCMIELAPADSPITVILLLRIVMIDEILLRVSTK
jgi:hypothetical protein